MSETEQPTTDVAGIERSPTGQIQDQSPAQPEATKPAATTKATDTNKPPPEPAPAPEPKAEKSLLSEKDEKASGAPEKYTDFKTPEGFELDKASLDKALPIFKELGLSQDAAQKMIDFYADLSKADMEATQSRFQETVKSWRDESLNHPDLRGKMDRNGPVLTAVAKTIDSLGPELAGAFREVMDMTGVGNHPAFIRAFYSLAQKLSEPGHVAGSGPSPFGQGNRARPASAASALYPNLPTS